MFVSQFITFARKRIGASLDRTEILFIANQVQNHILGRDIALQRVRPYPFLKTVDETFLYSASLSLYDSTTKTPGALIGDVRNVKRIYRTETISGSIFWDPENGYFPLLWIEPGDKPFFGDRGTEIDKDVGVTISRKPMANDCVIKWPRYVNPGDSTTLWKADAYLWPAQLTSENSEISIPDEFILPLLLTGVMESAEKDGFGNAPFPSKDFQDRLAEFDNKYNIEVIEDGVQSPGRVPFRDC